MSHTCEMYSKYFSTILFLCSDDKNSMHFILSLKNIAHNQHEQLVKLMQHCGANVSFNVENVSDHSAIIVDHNEVVNSKVPAFTLNYIEECLKKGKLQNISDYRQGATRHIAKDVQCMDVVYFRVITWDEVLTQWLTQEETSLNSSDMSEISEPLGPPSCNDILDMVNKRLGLDSSRPITQGKQSTTVTSVKHNVCLSSSEDEAIDEKTHDSVNGIKTNKTNKNIDNVKTIKKPNVIWRKAHETRSKSETAEHSEKNRIVDIKSREVPSKSVPKSSKWAFLDEFQPENSDEEETETKTREDGKKNNFFECKALNEDLFNTNKDKKRSRLPYSYDEQTNILKYIVEHQEYSRIKGRELWMTMERRKICKTRTWQSMKEHFLKKIVFSLESYDFLTEDQKKKIKNVAF